MASVIATQSDQDALIYPHEPPLFVLMCGFSILLWAVLLLVTVGTILLWLVLAFFLYLFAHSAFISYLKGTGVRITAQQFPDLDQRIRDSCLILAMERPEAYLLHGNGVFNALATRFLGRHFIVLYADIVDAMAERPDALNFYIGHELGHIRRRHLVWGPWLWPAGLLPLLGAAYSRAREYTCDLHGAACCPSLEDARCGLAALAAGGKRWSTLDFPAYEDQVAETSGFWMSFRELTSDYPWLAKRIRRLNLSLSRPTGPPRSKLAFLLASFIPRLGMGGSSLIFAAAIVGILAAVAIPAYQDYTVRAKVTEALNAASPLKTCVVQYFAEHHAAPAEPKDCGLDSETMRQLVNDVDISYGEGGAVVVKFGDTHPIVAGRAIVL